MDTNIAGTNLNKGLKIMKAARAEGITFFLEKGKVKMKVPEGKKIADNLLNDIRKHKEEIAQLLQHDLSNAGNTKRKINIADRNNTRHFPLAFSQERLWFLDQLQGSQDYHIPVILRLKGNLLAEGVQYALQQVINRHEVLRSIIGNENGIPYQVVMPADSLKLDYNEVAITAEEAENIIAQVIARPFDLAHDHMLRAQLLRLGEDEFMLVVILHHIAADAWSMNILVEEFAALYKSYTEKQTVSLPVPELQYIDYAVWQRRYEQEGALEEQLAYWKNKLEDAVTLELPIDHPRKPVQGISGNVQHFTLSKELNTALTELSKQQQVTLFMTLVSVLKILLYRYSGQTDISIGTPVGNRRLHELSGMIGFFANTLVLRSGLDDKMRYDTFLNEVKQTILDAYDNQEVPFEKVVEAVVKERDLSRNPLFQVMLLLQNDTVTLAESFLGDRLVAHTVSSPLVTTKFDLSFSLRESMEGLQLSVTYSTDLFTPATIQRLCTHYEQLLSSVVNDPTATIGSLQLLSTEEEELLLNIFNATDTVYPADQTVADLFALQVARTPDNTAVTFESQSLSYRELDAASNQVANYLRSQGIGPGSLVPVCLDRSLEMIIGLLGILKSGGAYVPIDPEYPLERIRYILSDIGAALLLVNKDSQAGLSSLRDVTLVSLDSGLIQEHSTDSPNSRPGVQDLCYVIYTSGTTGRPKGVMVGHHGLTNRLCWGQQRYGLDVSDTVLQKTTFCFDVSVWELFWPLISGARLLFARVGGHKDPAYLKQLIASEGVTVLHFVPSMLEVFLQELGAGDCAGVRHVFCSGEALGATQVRALHRQLPAAKLHNLYGPTEATIEVSYWDAEGEDVGVVPIGRPVANTQLYVLDAAQRLVPLGGIGELYIGGVQVAGGYLHQPELSVSHFIADRFRGAGRLYRTGDLVRWQADGQLLYLGRKDSQVKLRGYRIELGEVERVLEQARGIRQAVVLLRGSSAEGYLAAYVVVDEQYERALVESYIRSRVPSYMVPAAIVSMDQLPLTGSGKVDRRRLAALDSTVITGSYEAPESSMESALVAIWQELLKKDRIGVTDNFFELGGHSLLATRVVSRIRRDLGREISIRDLFTHPTVRSLAMRLHTNEDEVLQPGIIAGARPERIPLSFSQERLWFINQLQGSREYHIPGVFRLKGAVDVDALRYGLQQVINRHEVLRSVLKSEHDQTWQEVLPEDQWELVCHEVATSAISDQIREVVALPFDLGCDHMLRAHLFKVTAEDHLLVIVLHHIASDGWSLPILVKEFISFYQQATTGADISLPVLPVQYADYAIWQHRNLSGPHLDMQLAYWQNRLNNSQPLELPTDHVRPARQSGRGATIQYVLRAALQSSLEQLSRQEGVTMFMTLLSVFKVLLYRYSGQHDISIGSPVANRQRAEVEGLIGFFVNTLVLRSELRSDISYREYLQALRRITLEAYDHQDAPFEKVVERVVRDRDLSRHPLFQVMFVLQNNESVGIRQELLGEGLSLYPTPVEINRTRFDLAVAVKETAEGLHLSITYSTDLYEAATISRLCGHYEELLTAVLRSPESPIGRLNMLGASERKLLLDAFNDTGITYAAEKTLVDVFEEQAARIPNQVAIVSGERMLTYRQLDEHANRLAHYLQTKYSVG
ncbi:non-ribosomal peptide synthetase, partial [Chitinophaga sp. GbtcB8]|uniref:non-ribosomal peptide synthetase n=1 Tax=Chitinophaga sp. GbtcB8 TaxID=2824753 RepID=UPI001C2F562D